ncbi:MAG TPA: hypothetical protein VL967_08695 [Terracidiphilus sp.]|nr:hypothetical protein [Terracidiphilus sp.]
MNTHPYLRAFLAGAFVPTLVLPLMLAGFIVARLVLQVALPIERGLVFPLALVPLLWALWNMLWIGSHARTHLPIGIHGALLPCILMPCGAVLATYLGILAIGAHGIVWFQALDVSFTSIAPMFLAALAAYYLAWKYIVGFLNRVLGIA